MPVFQIVGMNASRKGEILEVTADCEAEAREEARRRGILVVDIGVLPEKVLRKKCRKRLLPAARLQIFCERLQPMLQMNMPPRTALGFMAKNAPDAMLRRTCMELQAGMKDCSLADVIGQSPRFPPLVKGVIKVGGDAAEQASALGVLARYYRMLNGTNRAVRHALIQPALAGLFMLFFMATSLFIIIPRFGGLLASLNLRPSAPFRLLLFVSEGALRFWPVTMVLGGAVVALLAKDNPLRRMAFEWLAAQFGPLKAVVYGARQTMILHGLAILLSAGVKYRQTLEYLRDMTRGTVFEFQFAGALADHAREVPFADCLARHVKLDDEIIFSLRVGMETATAESQVRQMAELYEKNTQQACDAFAAKVTPIFSIILVVMMVGVYLCTFGSLFSVLNRLARGGM
ncbi:MAG: type II secretion system F family protein [Verrucomicrobiae bacterium]|nr:type II secretion system F family protein [Verrucomicrobiae bacterium]